MKSFEFLRDLAIIIIAAKCFGMLARKLKAPQVVGEIIAGLIIGPNVLGIVSQNDFLVQMAELGVILLMFLAGLETNLQDLLKTGPIALLVACCGVFIPLLGGYLLYSGFHGFAGIGTDEFFKAVFIGVILTATSVSITVSTLRELGHLKGKVGTTILSAAVIDDVIGILVLTFVIGFKNPDVDPVNVVVSTVLFFLFCGGVGLVGYFLFRWMERRHPNEHRRRMPIYGLALCLLLSYAAEEYFGIADITGAYVAGIILCSIKSSDYIAEKMDISSYMLFGPIFFASIGLKTQVKGMTASLLVFSLAFVVVALLTKVVGCGFAAKICKFSNEESLKIGVGMMTRGEVALIVAQKGLSVGLMDPLLFTSVILLIIVSSIATPIILKVLYHKFPEKQPELPENVPVSQA